LPKGDNTDFNKGFLVGFFLAEGSFTYSQKGKKKKNTVYSLASQKRWNKINLPNIREIVLSCGTLDIKRGYLDIILKEFPNIFKIYKYDKCVILKSRKRDIINFILKHVKGKTCDTKCLTDLSFNKSIKFIEGIVEGFLSGDGYYDVKNDRWRVGIKPNENLKDNLLLCCRILGYDFRYCSTRTVKA
jgi:hypothetical protein